MIDIKDRYVRKADELVRERFGADWDMYDLTPAQRSEICEEASRLVDEELQENADLIREDLILRCPFADL